MPGLRVRREVKNNEKGNSLLFLKKKKIISELRAQKSHE